MRYIIQRSIREFKSKGDTGLLLLAHVFGYFIRASLSFCLNRKWLRKWLYTCFLNRNPLQSPSNTQKPPKPKLKTCVYTVLIGDYDGLKEPLVVNEDWDYICITDNRNLHSSVWRFCYVDNDDQLDAVRWSRKYKCLNHLVDQHYDLSLYIDANILITDSLTAFVAHAYQTQYAFAILYHPYHVSLDEERKSCIQRGLDDPEIITKQYQYYTQEQGYQDQLPQINARLIIRKTKQPLVKAFMSDWFDNILKGSKRDQLSFNPVYAKYQARLPIQYINYWKFRQYFEVKPHHHAHNQAQNQ